MSTSLAQPRHALAALLAVAALLVALPTAAHGGMAKGLQDDRMILADDPDLRAAFWASAFDADVKTVRVLVNWNGTATPDPDRVARIRRAATEGRAVGVRLLVTSYATIGRGRSASYRVPARVSRNYTAFMGKLARALADLPLAGYVSFNEPNYKTAWPLGHERQWVTLSNGVYRAIKRADRGAQVLVGEPSPLARGAGGAANPGAFFRTALCLKPDYRSADRTRGCKTRLLGDGFTLHTYDFDRAPNQRAKNPDVWVHGNLASAVAQIKRLAKAGRISAAAARNVQITEFAYRTEGSYATPPGTAAAWLKLAWSSAKRHGIKTFVWYQLRDPVGASDWKSGLQSDDGAPRPTWTAFRALR